MRYSNYLLVLLAAFLGACGGNYQAVTTTPARLGTKTPTARAFNDLPAPEKKIIAAVYKFRDQTGQYKPATNGASWSTAVTQGATSILLRSLEESGWFVPIEREGLSNLLNERKIIRSSQAAYLDQSKGETAKLPPLLFGDIVLEGGIISYDANVVTGGAGLQYFGTGAHGQYREDRVTVYLRAVSTSNGKILKTVYTTKTVLSQMIDFGVFRYVAFKRLLEAEVGTTYNEPMELAVTQAIEKAVHTLVIEGMLDGLWANADGSVEQQRAVKMYLEEKRLNDMKDDRGELITQRRGQLKIGLGAGANMLFSDYQREGVSPVAGAKLGYLHHNGWFVDISAQMGGLKARGWKQNYFHGGLDIGFQFRQHRTFSPYVMAGLGYAQWNKNINFPYDNSNLEPIGTAYSQAGVGVDIALTSFMSVFGQFAYQYYLTDDFDGLRRGRYNDYQFNGMLGLNFYLFRH
ncbi:CsgG/HfaB family protein [Persicobacter psychrovividus]|uniref:Outer membrane protein beta-barrel domain-containing protein n=1 Tax=Persicobacter psychrovividus TaxID=387638 RepID=A0ABN6L6Z3_9BACT|nr:hypothetical protein PEPS_12330 [Persicobacter psychrovividus]